VSRSTLASIAVGGTVAGGTAPGSGVLGAGVAGRTRAACLPFWVFDGWAAASPLAPDGPAPAETSHPAATAIVTAASRLTVIAAREARISRYARAILKFPRRTAALRFASGQLHIVTMLQISS
jgi:hypothetical protein